MKKHKYDPELVYFLVSNRDYWFIFFDKQARITRNKNFIPKERRNGDLTMLCPLHKENTPSFRINAKNNCFKCFGCGKSGTFLGFLNYFYNQSLFQSLEMAFEMKFPDYPKDPNQLELDFPKDIKITTKEDLDLPF